MQNWAVITSQIINVAAAIFFILFFSFYLYRIKRLAESQRFIHLYPYRRIIFVVLYILINVIQVVLFIIQPVSQSGLFNAIELYFLIGTCLNSLILGFQLYILYVEIKKQKPFNMIHLIYWLYLACISLMRLILEAYYQKGMDVNTSELVLSSLLFADALILFVYSWFMKRYQIKQFQNMAEQRFLMLSKPSGIELKKYESQDSFIFPYLTVDLSLNERSQLVIKVFSNSELLSTIKKSSQELSSFYTETLKFNLKAKLDFEKRELNVLELQQFFLQLLQKWQNYDPFVLDFLQVNEESKKQITRCRSQKSAFSRQTLQSDFSIIYYDVRLPSMVKNGDHYEFDITVWTNDYESSRTVHKRYSQFQDLDKKLKSFDFKGLKLKTPELPQKIYFNVNEEKLCERKNKLEIYIKRLLNDKIFVKKYQQTKLVIFHFFNFDLEEFALVKQLPMPFEFAEISYEKGLIVRQMMEKDEQYIVCYYFDIILNGSKIGEFKGRFSAFEQFHQQFKRWMHNTQIEYKSVKFPVKIPHSSEAQKHKRHIQLTQYLNSLVSGVPNLFQFYQARKFLLDFQQIKSLKSSSLSKRSSSIKNSDIDEQFQDSHRSHMSQLIDNLQFDSGNM